MKLLRQSTAQVISLGPFVSPTDGVTLQTGLVSALDNATTGIMLSKTGGAFAVRHATVTASTYDAYGNYRVTLDATDTATLGILRVQFAAAASCAPVWEDFTVVPAVVYDALVSGTDNLDVSVVQWLGTACATPTVAGVPEVDLTHIGGDAQSQIDLKDFADAGYDPVTNKVQGLVLADTVTTYTGNTPQTGDSFARIGLNGAGLTALSTQASVNTVAGYVDTEVAQIISDVAALSAKVGTPAGVSVSADIAAVQTDTNDIQTRLPAALVGGRMDGNIGAVDADAGAAAKLKRVLIGNVTGTAGTGSTTTSIVTSALLPAASVADQFKGRIVTFDDATTTAALRGQSTDITASSAVGVLTVTALTTAPVAGDTFTVS